MNKSLKIIATIFILLTSTKNSFAKREGLFIGADLIRYDLDLKRNLSSSSETTRNSYSYDTLKDSQHKNLAGFGINLNYALSHADNNFFAAPSMSLQFLGLKNKTKNLPIENLDISSRLSLKTDFGYDIADRLAIFIPIGLNVISYKLYREILLYDQNNKITKLQTKNTTRSVASPFTGLGLSLKLFENLYLEGEYNYTAPKLSADVENQNFSDIAIEIKTNMNIVRTGLKWQF